MSQFVRSFLKLSSKQCLIERSYTRWTHRRPLKVYDPESEHNLRPLKVLESDPKNQKFESRTDKKVVLSEANDPASLLKHKVAKPIKLKTTDVKKAISEVDDESKDVQTLRIENGEITFKKLKQHDKILSTLMLSIKSRKRREQRDTVLFEGKRLIRDALQAGCQPLEILFSRVKEVNEIVDLLPKENVSLYRVPYKELQVWSALTTCPGIMGIFKTPDVSSYQINDSSIPLTIICDNIREPGNLGAIIRSAAAVGCQNLLLTKGCVELWDSKVLRSGSGGHFRTAIEQDLTWDEIKLRLSPNSSVFVADNKSETCTSMELPLIPYHGVNYGSEIAVVIGGETFGLSEEAYCLAKDTAGARLHIPLVNGVDSLNTGTALGIIVFEIKRQMQLLGEGVEKKVIQR